MEPVARAPCTVGLGSLQMPVQSRVGHRQGKCESSLRPSGAEGSGKGIDRFYLPPSPSTPPLALRTSRLCKIRAAPKQIVRKEEEEKGSFADTPGGPVFGYFRYNPPLKELNDCIEKVARRCLFHTKQSDLPKHAETPKVGRPRLL